MSQQRNELIQQDIIASDDNDDGIDLLGLIQTLGEEKWLLFGLPCICACVAAVISLYIPPTYTAKATFIVPDKQPNSASAVLDQLGGLGGLGSLGRSSNEMYVALMQSNTVQDKIITELGLMKNYQTKTLEDTRKKLLSLVKITIDKKSGLIVIEAQDQSQDLAAKLANAYLKPFREVLNSMSLEEAHLRRDFFAQQIEVIAQRPFRDPFLQSALINSMIKQYEVARIDEAKAKQSQILFTVDVAKIPERKSSPKRALIVISVGFSVLFITLVWIFTKKVLRIAQCDPASSQKLAMLKKAWKLHS